MTTLSTNTDGKCCLVLQVPINSENQYYLKLVQCLRHLPIQRLARKYWKNTEKIVYSGAAGRALGLFE